MSKVNKYITYSAEKTKDIGAQLIQKLQGGDIILLYGELGTGKTTLTQGISSSLKIKEKITSPTFTIMHIYSADGTNNIKTLVHVDTYRIEDESQLKEIGLEDYLGDPDTLCVIEWPDKMGHLLDNKKTIDIYLEHITTGRAIRIEYD